MSTDDDQTSSLEEERQKALDALRDRLGLDPNVPVWMPTMDEWAKATRSEITKEDIYDACLGVSTEHSRHLVLCHCMTAYYTLGPKLDGDLTQAIAWFTEKMKLAEEIAGGGHHNSVKVDLKSAFPGLRLWELDHIFASTLRFSRFKRRFAELSQQPDSEPLSVTDAQNIVSLLHGSASEATSIKAAITADWFEQTARDLIKAAAIHPSYLTQRLMLRRQDLRNWSRAIPNDLLAETKLIQRKEPEQFDKRTIDSAKAFVAQSVSNSSKGRVGAILTEPDEAYSVREAVGNRLLLHFQKERGTWKRSEQYQFFVPGEPTALAAIFLQEGQ